MTRLTSQASRFVLNPLCPKPIRPRFCQFVVRNLDDVDRCDGERVNSNSILFVLNQFVQIEASLIIVSLFMNSLDTLLYPKLMKV